MVLPDVILEEIFLRLPPDEPESLLRASLASKLWLGRLTSPAFQGRYREFHGAPPMLGFLFSSSDIGGVQELVSTTTKFRARIPDDGWSTGLKYVTWDCRHGRVLIKGGNNQGGFKEVAVWDPITGRRSVLVAPGESWCAWAAAVLCGVAGCDHRACHDGPFRVILVDIDRGVAYVRVSSPETGEWSKPCPALEVGDAFLTPPSVLVGDGLYFMFTYFADDTIHILKYDLASDRLSVLGAPAGAGLVDASILMAMQDRSLGYANLDYKSTLRWWSRQQQMGSESDGAASSWTPRGVIDLKSFLPAPIHSKLLLPMGSVEGSDIVFVTTTTGFTTDDDGIYQINLNSLHSKKLWKTKGFVALLPYMSYYNPRGVPKQTRSAM